MNIKSHMLQLAKYGFFGVLATLVHLLTAWAIIYFFAASVFVANTFAFFTAFVFSYVFQTLYVFHSTFHFKKLMKFFLVQYGTFLASYFLSDAFPVQNSYLHTLLIVAIMPLITFVVHKFWTFK
ncbi:GtrA family protein [Sulfurimonas sp. SWIR-19]|uniref:GtrA family protein n=1 Tax=Sulfurimonas sp. SWIR-19 TaxID=2878390 RepID=UPI001CF50F4E|nr:GtrA family protein [Sulfurimonas sp. SWIR-19]UCN01066.1 GtrA family protein [Sulfurimonas sp. SWIR-19]